MDINGLTWQHLQKKAKMEHQNLKSKSLHFHLVKLKKRRKKYQSHHLVLDLQVMGFIQGFMDSLSLSDSETVRSRPNHNPSKVPKRKTMKSQSHCFLLVKLNRNQKKRRIRQSFHLVAALTKPKKRQNLVLVLNPMIKRMKKKSPLNLLVDFLPI